MIIENRNGDIVFTGKDSARMRHMLDHPNPERAARRRAFLEEARESVRNSVKLPDGSVLVHMTAKNGRHGF